MNKIKSTKGKSRKKLGRPFNSLRILSEEIILKSSQEILDLEGLDKFSMRSLAKKLEIDPMSIYNYFKSKNEILIFILNSKFKLFILKIKNKNSDLKIICNLYLKFCFQNIQLIQYLSYNGGDSTDIKILSTMIQNILNKKGFSNKETQIIYNLLIDFIHGFSISKPMKNSQKLFNQELDFILKGIE